MAEAAGVIIPILAAVSLVAVASRFTDRSIDWIARRLNARPVKW